MNIARALPVALALWLFAAGALAQEARDITQACAFTSPEQKTTTVHDGQYTTCWNSRSQEKPYLQIDAPEGEAARYLYLCFGRLPERWALQEKGEDGKWRAFMEGTSDYLHVLLDVGGRTQLRVVETSGYKTRLKINEAYVFTEGDLPDWVQRWQPTPEKADLLLLAAHPDDELLFFGGTIPTYAAERGLDVVVAYMVGASSTRRSELLNGLWALGVRHYPVIGTFGDVYARGMNDLYDAWGKERVRRYVMGLVRRYKPEVMVTHDVNGEYGHGAHRVCADAARYCVENGADPSVLRESAEEYGAWQVKKLYLHLYEENPIVMDWRQPLSAFGGKTGLQLAREAFALHVSQQNSGYAVDDEGETSCARFGLAYTAVGPDVAGGDFMENIEGL